jgi:hypothetical protein
MYTYNKEIKIMNIKFFKLIKIIKNISLNKTKYFLFYEIILLLNKY